jgi:integrase
MAVGKDKVTGRWYSKFRYHDLSGKTIQKRKIGFATRKEAAAWEKDFIERHEGRERLTFKQAFERYLDDCGTRQKKTTLAAKKRAYKHYEDLYELPVMEITPQTIRRWQNNNLLQLDNNGIMKYTKSTISNINTTLSGFFAWAIKFLGLTMNPVQLAGSISIPGKAEKRGAKKNIWQLPDFNKFIDYIDRSDYHLIFNLLFWTGIRRGECLGLRVKDYNSNDKTISVKQNMTPYGLDTPKTRTSTRIVSLPDILATEIEEYIGRMFKPLPNDLLFTMQSQRLSHYFQEKQKQAGIETKIRIHDLRHSHASFLINQGLTPDVVGDRLGHANAQMVLRLYGHMYPQKRDEVKDILNKAISGKKRKTASKK